MSEINQDKSHSRNIKVTAEAILDREMAQASDCRSARNRPILCTYQR